MSFDKWRKSMGGEVDIGSAISDSFISAKEEDRDGNPANLTDGLFAIAHSIDRLTSAVHLLGNADAATPMGAMEALGKVLQEGLSGVAESIYNVSTSIDHKES